VKSGSMNELEQARHAEERGAILRLLSQDFNSEMTSVGSLLSSLDLLGHSLGWETFCFHLNYLKEDAYIRLWLTRDMPGYRSDRIGAGSPSEIRFAKLLPKGLRLIDGHLAADPMVRF
jgi:hypothetical protein